MRAFLVTLAGGLLLLGGGLIGAVREGAGAAAGGAPGPTRAVEQLLAGSVAFYGSGGDPRVAADIPARPELIGEMASEIAFGQHRLQVGETRQLLRVEWLGARAASGGAVEIRTRELWVNRSRPLSAAEGQAGQGAPGRAASEVVWASYDVEREGDRWVVSDYRLVAPPAAPRPGGP